MVKDKYYFIITTNIDHRFQMEGFDKNRLFYTQGDYGLFQSTDTNCKDTYDNKNSIYACLNLKEAFCPEKINDRSICIDGDIGEVLKELK